MGKMGERTIRFSQRLFLVIGIVLLSTYLLTLIHRTISSRLALNAFGQAQATAIKSEASNTTQPKDDGIVDFSLWSEKRISEYKKSLLIEKQLPWAVLSIEKLKLRVPVFEGTNDLVLNRGVGWIIGTAKSMEAGNIGIAGHRDGFFRGLKDIVIGDKIKLTLLNDQGTYVVDQIDIVDPERIDVLQPQDSPSLTLVTCYPFYFIGNAPQRFIVRAILKHEVTAKTGSTSLEMK